LYVCWNQSTMEKNINEDHLANLYIFLAQQFSESEEVKSQNSQGTTFKSMESNILQRLQSLGSTEASAALQKMIIELPDQKEDLQQKLLQVENLIRRTTWKYPKPEDILKLVVNNELSNLELHDTLNSMGRNIQQMAGEPKIDQSIHIIRSANSIGRCLPSWLSTKSSCCSDASLDASRQCRLNNETHTAFAFLQPHSHGQLIISVWISWN
jgi:hypothetical protein